jgi:hypothetical protein
MRQSRKAGEKNNIFRKFRKLKNQFTRIKPRNPTKIVEVIKDTLKKTSNLPSAKTSVKTRFTRIKPRKSTKIIEVRKDTLKKTLNQPSTQTSVTTRMEKILNQFSNELFENNEDSMDTFLKTLQSECRKEEIDVKGIFTIPIPISSKSGGVGTPRSPRSPRSPKPTSPTRSPTQSPESSQSSLETFDAPREAKIDPKEAKRDASSLLLSIKKNLIKGSDYIGRVKEDFYLMEDDLYLEQLKNNAMEADNFRFSCNSKKEDTDIPNPITLDKLSRTINLLRSTSTDESDIDLINLDFLSLRKDELEKLCKKGEISKGYGEHILSAWRDIFNEITILVSNLYELGYKKKREEITTEEFTKFFKQIEDPYPEEDPSQKEYHYPDLQNELLSYLVKAVHKINSTYPENSPLYVAQRYYSGGYVFFFYTSAQLTDEPRSDGTTQSVFKMNKELGLEEDLFHITIHTGSVPLTRESYLGSAHTTSTSQMDARAKFNRRVNLYPILFTRWKQNKYSPEQIVQLIPYYSPVVVNNALVRKTIPFILGSINEFLYLSQMRNRLLLSAESNFERRTAIPEPIHLKIERPPPRPTLASIRESASASASASESAPASTPPPSRAEVASSWRRSTASASLADAAPSRANAAPSRANAAPSQEPWRRRAGGVSIKKKKKKKKRTQKSRYDTIKI